VPDEALKPGLRAALRVHEIGRQSPYQLMFAAKGASGASFGFMQGDLAAGQPEVTRTFHDVLADAGMDRPTIDDLQRRLGVHLIDNPLSPGESERVNAALLAGRAKVDAMDETILAKVYDGLDQCRTAATAAQRSIAPEAQIYMALWINMSGPPSKLLHWLSGDDPRLRKPVPPPGSEVNSGDIRAYLGATDYFTENPRNFMHMVESVAAGMAVLQGAPSPIAAPPESPAAASAEEDAFVYEQATGQMLLVEDGMRDLIGKGYSGSEAEGGKNNPHAQCEKDIGPIPRGRYTIGAPFAGPSPLSLRLTPDAANDMCGRDGFLIHGDSIAEPGTASHGCIILNRLQREQIAASPIKLLRVVERLV
jgi:type VI secretion system (T6SS) effector TldE1-like protein